MKTAKVSELKAKLSAYLAEVRGGGTVVVYDRATPIARLVPFQGDDDLVIMDASAPASELRKIKGVKPRKRIDLDRVLRESRGDRAPLCHARQAAGDRRPRSGIYHHRIVA